MKTYFFLVFSFVSSSLLAQINTDSLWGVWKNQNLPDTARLRALHTYTNTGFLNTKPDSAFKLGQIMYEFAKNKNNPQGMADAKHLQGLSLSNLGRLDEVLKHYEECLTIREKVNDKIGITHILNNIANIYKNKGVYDKALEVHERNLALKQGLGDERNVSATLYNMGVIYSRKGEYETALKYYISSLEIDKRLGNKDDVAKVLNSIGIVYYHQGNISRAIQYWTESLNIQEQLGDKRGVANALNNIGVIYDNQGEYEKALEYHEKALALRRQINDKRGIATSLHNMGVIYNLQSKTDKSLEVNLESLKHREQTGDKPGMAHSYNNIGEAYRISRNFPEAIFAHQKSLGIREDIGDKDIGSSLTNLGLTYLDMGDYKKAIGYSERGLSQAKQVEMAANIRDASRQLYDAYRALGENEKALEYYELHIAMRDSIDSEENQRQVLRQEYKYSYEKEALSDSLAFAKKEAIMQEKTKRQQLGLAASGLGLMLLMSLAFAIYKGKKRSDELLLNILPKETAKELKARGQADAKLIENTSVLFTDFKGFTALAEQLSPEELVEDLNTCFSEFDRIMEKYGIEKIKTIGDAYMAAGGLPTPNATHASDVVKAALEMRDFIEKGKAKKIEQGLPYFEIRIGIHTGPVVAGIVGIKKFQYDIWGDTVNTASRMESSGEVGKVNISETTHELVKHEFYFKYRGEVEAKGKGLLKMFFVEQKA